MAQAEELPATVQQTLFIMTEHRRLILDEVEREQGRLP